MAATVNIADHFDVTDIGNGLAKLWHVDSLSLRLENAMDEDGMLAMCPITLSPITQNAVLLQDGFVYQQGPIEDWLKKSSMSPRTGLAMGHRKSFRMHPLTAVINTFLEACQKRRDAMRDHHVEMYKEMLARSNIQETYDQHIQAFSKLQTYIAEGRSESAAWDAHLRELESIAAALGESLQTRARQQNWSLARSSLDSAYKAVAHRQEVFLHIQACAKNLIAKQYLGITADMQANIDSAEKCVKEGHVLEIK